MRYVFVAATGFVGSTLLSFLMNSHKDVVSVGEATGPTPWIRDPEAFPCSCGKPISQCPFWCEVYAEMSRRGVPFGPKRWRTRFRAAESATLNHILTRSLRNNRLDALRDALVIRSPGWGERLRVIAHRNEALARSILSVSGARVFVDASKDPVQAKWLDRLTGLEPLVVHLVRDPVGFVSSHVKNKSRRRPELATIEAGVRAWNRMAAHMERFFASLPPERRLRVRYEDLCRSTEDELGRLAKFAGVEPLRAPVAFRKTEHHILGNRMRLQGSDEIKLDDSWRERLSASEVERVRASTRRYRRRFGYD